MPIDDNKKPDADKKIGEVYSDGSLRSSSFSSKAVLVGGYVTSAIGSILAKDITADVLKENISAYEFADKDGFIDGLAKSAKRFFDPKLWKSNAVGLVTLGSGVLLTGYLVKKIEQDNFKEKHGHVTQEQIATIVKATHPEDNKAVDSQSTNWQDKTKSQAESQLGNQRL